MTKQRKSRITGRKNSQRELRRLSVVMFTDMVGYSAVTQKDESLALRLLEEHRRILRPHFARHGGKEIKTIGDAFLVEFASALEATDCAVDIQKSLHERNASAANLPPIHIRIGLHVGDVIFKEGDVYGDGVNIASRIEPLAGPGGICISEDVARQIRNKTAYPLVALGKGELKNIELPVTIYRIALPWKRQAFAPLERVQFLAGQRRTRRIAGIATIVLVAIGLFLWRINEGASGPLPKKNIAVLPLLNISANPREDYFADGMTEELISHLAMIRDLSVIARSSVSQYKTAHLDIADIGRRLNVGTVLEGSVQTSGDRARIIVNLIDVNNQHHLWTQEYNRELKDLFAVQTDIAVNVTGALKAELLSGEMEMLNRKATDDNTAHDIYLQGLSHLDKRTGDEIMLAIDLFGRAVRHDSAFALAYAGLAECYTLVGSSGYGTLPRDRAVEMAKYYAAKAIALDPTQAEAHTSLGYVKFRIDWDWTGAEREFKRSLELKPGNARTHEWYGLFLSIQGRFDEAMAEMKRARELDPLSPSVATGIGRILHFSRRFAEAVSQFQNTIAADSTYAEAHFGLGMTYTVMKRFEDAHTELTIAKKLSGDRPIVNTMIGVNYGMWGKRKEALRIIQQLSALQRRDKLSPYYRGLVYAGIGDIDRSMADLNKAFQLREGLLVYGNVEPMFVNLKADPRFRVLLENMGLRPR